MTCKELYDFLDRYVGDDLEPDVRARFERHLIDCPPCGDYLASYRTTIELGRDACREENAGAKMPDALVRAILNSVREGGSDR